MPDLDEYPEILTREQLRFEITFSLQQVGKATVKEWGGTNREKAERARAAAVETILVHFDRLQVRRHAPAENIFQDRVKPR